MSEITDLKCCTKATIRMNKLRLEALHEKQTLETNLRVANFVIFCLTLIIIGFLTKTIYI